MPASPRCESGTRTLRRATPALRPRSPAPTAHSPASVYLSAHDSDTARPTMRRALDTVAALLLADELDHQTLPWHLQGKATWDLDVSVVENRSAAAALLCSTEDQRLARSR
ncbi:hypothetical protein [Nonomuraea roseola]|uniref:Uncharacterized protein n=1 Tax=Nonomuraea roseola TaxID=46179 RepID=A0ABV5Q8P6_9ACTN